MKTLQIGDFIARVPIVQGGMGVGISLSNLASAVAEQGGIGVISSAGLGVIYRKFSSDYAKASIEGLRCELRKARQATQGIIGVNVMVAMSNFADMVRTAIEEKADIIFSGAGLPLDLPRFRSEKCRTALAPIISSARAAKLLCSKWMAHYGVLPDAVVVEGPEAGGHLGYKPEQIDDAGYSLHQTVPQVVETVGEFASRYGVEIPVIAGGGIYTGGDIYDIMERGASGVQMGTRFVATDECDAAPEFKQAYVQATREDLEIIASPVGMPGRAIGNSFLEKVRAGLTKPLKCPFNCISTCKADKSPYCIMLALYNAFRGNLQSGYAFAGANAWRIEKIQSVKSLFEELRQQFDARMHRG